MARKYTARSEVSRGSFDFLEHESQKMGEHMDCSVKAVAATCGVGYRESWQAHADSGRKFRGRTPFRVTFDAVRLLGKQTTAFGTGVSRRFGVDKVHMGVALESLLLDRLRTEYNYDVLNLTTRQLTMFPDLCGRISGHWLVFTNGHVLAMSGGKVHCWAATRALRIKEFVEVT